MTDLPKRYDTASRLAYLERMVNELTRQQGTQTVNPGSIDHALNVRDFGAVGDGVTDDTVAFIEIANLNRVGYVPAGTYVISSASTELPGGYWFGEGTLLFTGTGMGGATQTLDRSIAAATNSGITIAASSVAVTALTAPLITAGRVVYTDRTFAQAIATVLTPVPATLTDVPGLTSTVDVDSTGDIYLVMMTLDLDLITGQTAPNGPFEARLMVNGVLRTPNANWRWLSGSAAGQRATVSQQWLITGQAVGNRIFKIQARDTTGGGTAFRVNATHSQMTIVQQQ